MRGRAAICDTRGPSLWGVVMGEVGSGRCVQRSLGDAVCSGEAHSRGGVLAAPSRTSDFPSISGSRSKPQECFERSLGRMSDRKGECERFCAQVSPRLVGSLTLYCGDRLLAEEIAQEALVRAFERWGRVGAMASPEAWAYRTAFNLAAFLVSSIGG